MDAKYTAEDLHIAFVAAKYFMQPQAGTLEESWKRNVAKARRDVESNRSDYTTAQVERLFNTARAALETESQKQQGGAPKATT